MTTPGVGAWNVPKWYGPDTAAAPTDLRIGFAVEAIQKGLNAVGFPCPVTGTYGAVTYGACRAYQAHVGTSVLGPIDGLAGRLTCHALFRPYAWFFEQINDRHVVIPGHYLAGVIAAESGWDPGAQGEEDNADRGIAQINAVEHPEVSDATAYGDAIQSIIFACHRVLDGFATFKRWDAAIVYYNSPADARTLATGGTMTAAAQKYLNNVLTLAAAGG